jgi:hypothetical protein
MKKPVFPPNGDEITEIYDLNFDEDRIEWQIDRNNTIIFNGNNMGLLDATTLATVVDLA